MHQRFLWLLAVALFLVVAPLHSMAPARAADDSLPPGFGEPGDGASISYVVTGELEQADLPVARLIVESVRLATGDSLGNLDDAQLISVESGNLTMTDDLGLAASLGAGEQLFAAADAYPQISADQPTTLLRARLTAPESDITIENDACTPTNVIAAIQDGLTIGNASTRDQPIVISEIGFSATVPAGETVIVPIAAIPDGEWQASCGLGSNGNPLDEIAITVTSGAQPEASPTPDDGSTVIFSNEIALPSADTATFFMADMALAADGSLGKQTFAGTTVVAANDQPLWFKRPRRLTSTLAAGASAVIPTGTQVTIENAGKEPATVLLVGVAPPADSTPQEHGPEPTPSCERSVTRDGCDQEDTSAVADPVLARYIPSSTQALVEKFVEVATIVPTTISKSIFADLAESRALEGWEQAIIVKYVYPITGRSAAESTAYVSVDQFASLRDAAAAYQALTLSYITAPDAEPLDTPISGHFSPNTIVILTVHAQDRAITQSTVVARRGNILLTASVIVPDDAPAKGLALTLWAVIEHHLDDQSI